MAYETSQEIMKPQYHIIGSFLTLSQEAFSPNTFFFENHIGIKLTRKKKKWEFFYKKLKNQTKFFSHEKDIKQELGVFLQLLINFSPRKKLLPNIKKLKSIVSGRKELRNHVVRF